jgi:hypothetical protein
LQLPLLLDMLQATPQKIDLQRLPTHFPLQFGNLTLIGPSLPIAREGPRPEIMQFPTPPVQNVGIDFAGPRYFGQRSPQSQSPDCFFFKLLCELPSSCSHDSILHSMKNES